MPVTARGPMILRPLRGSRPLAACIRASVSFRFTPAEAQPLRIRLRTAMSKTMSPSVIKQLDDQSLGAVEAMRQAVESLEMTAEDLADWGIVGAPRQPGRDRTVDAIQSFRDKGPFGVSPHMVPQCGLHSLAGIVSQAFAMHGPCMGAGGRTCGVAEAMTVAVGWLFGEDLKGVWLIFSQRTPGEGATETDTEVLALALTRHTGATLSLPGDGPSTATTCPVTPELTFDRLKGAMASPGRWCLSVPGLGHLHGDNR